MTEYDADALRRLVKRADPAVSLSPLRDDQLVRLTEDAMTRTDPTTDTSPAAPRVRRGILIGGLAAAAVAIIAAIAIPLTIAGPAQQPTVLAVQPSDPMAMCAVVTAESIAEFSDTAFRADVTSIADGTVTLTVTERFEGDVSDTVEVEQGTDAALDGGPLIFEDGTTYLIGAADGQILTCGISGPADAALEALYAEAFGG